MITRILSCLIVLGVLMASIGTVGAETINVDLGGAVSATGWNTLSSYDAITDGTLLEDLVDSTDAATMVDLRLTDAWQTSPIRNGSAGTTSSTAFSPASSDATKYDMYIYEGDADHSAQIRIEGLLVSETYNFGFFDSYMSDADARRECKYIIGAQSVNLIPNYNHNNVAYINGVSPDSNGHVTIDLAFGALPEVLDKVCGLAVLTIEGNFVPEPVTLSLLALGGLLIRRKRV